MTNQEIQIIINRLFKKNQIDGEEFLALTQLNGIITKTNINILNPPEPDKRIKYEGKPAPPNTIQYYNNIDEINHNL